MPSRGGRKDSFVRRLLQIAKDIMVKYTRIIDVGSYSGQRAYPIQDMRQSV